MQRMDGNTCLMTGATSGIGKATAKGLAEFGGTIVIVGRDREKGESVRKEIIDSTGNKNVHLLVADLSLQSSIRNLVKELKNRFDRSDIFC